MMGSRRLMHRVYQTPVGMQRGGLRDRDWDNAHRRGNFTLTLMGDTYSQPRGAATYHKLE